MKIFLGELFKNLEANEIIAVKEIYEQARENKTFEKIDKGKLKRNISDYVKYYRERGVIAYNSPGYLERTENYFAMGTKQERFAVTKERAEKLINLVRERPDITVIEINKKGYHSVLRKFGNLTILKRSIGIEEKNITPYRFKSLKNRLSKEDVDKKFFEYINKHGKVPTAAEFIEYDKSCFSFIIKGYYTGIRKYGWTQYVESKGYKTHDPRRKLKPQIIKKLYYKGLSDKEIAKQLEVDRKAVAYWRNKLKLPSHIKREYNISKSLLRRVIKETGSFDEAAKFLRVKTHIIEDRAHKYGIKSPVFIYDDILGVLKKKGPRTMDQLIRDLHYKGERIDMKNLKKKHGVLSKELPYYDYSGPRPHIYYLNSQYKEAENILESYKKEKIQKLFDYLKRNPDTTYSEAKNEGFAPTIKNFFSNKINLAKKEAGIPEDKIKIINLWPKP